MHDYDAMLDWIRRGRRFVIASHASPDGDGIGSTVAMGMLLERMGKEAVFYNRDGLPGNLHFLPQADRFVTALAPEARFDGAIMVDCAQRKRISEAFAAHPGIGRVACIDHHILETPEAEVVLLDSDAASTGEVVYRLAKHAGMSVDPAMALCIYTTLVVDTGFFRYPNTNAAVLALASELVRGGADPWTVARSLEESYPAARMKLLGASLSSMAIDFGGRYATMEVTQAMLQASGAQMDYSDEFAVFPRSIDGVEVAALFREMGDGRIKVSMRSKDAVDVAAIARTFGGGGHTRASGFHLRATMGEVKAKLRAAIEQVLA